MKNEILKYIRDKNISVSELEQLLGLSNAVISRVIADAITYPSVETMIKLANLLGVSVDDLLQRDLFTNKLVHTKKDTRALDRELMVGTLKCLIELLEDRNQKIDSTSAVLEAIANLYDYYRKKNTKILQEDVVSFIIDKISTN